MAKIQLDPDESLVLVDFLLRFREKDRLSIKHLAEEHVLMRLCALLETQVPTFGDPAYANKLEESRRTVAASVDEDLKQHRLECEEIARGLHFVRQPYAAEDMLVAREPNEAGLFASHPYHGETFDDARYRLVRAGWDHDHCFLCQLTIEPGDEWWAAEPPDEIGLCLECYQRLFGA